jgi:hypothetical protein
MTARRTTKAELIAELSGLRQRVAQLEALAADFQLVEDKATWLASFPEQNPNPVIETDASPISIRRLRPSFRSSGRRGNHWPRVRLEGAGKVNRDAIGSWVELTAGGITQRQQVMPTRSFLSQVERTITFGLGKAEQVDKLVVHWTDGTTTNVDVPSVNRVIEVRKQTPPAQ